MIVNDLIIAVQPKKIYRFTEEGPKEDKQPGVAAHFLEQWPSQKVGASRPLGLVLNATWDCSIQELTAVERGSNILGGNGRLYIDEDSLQVSYLLLYILI